MKNAPEQLGSTSPVDERAPPAGGARPAWMWGSLVAVPIAGALVRFAVVGAPALQSKEGHSAEVALAEAAATFGCFFAATSFGRRDHLARAWAVQGLMYSLLLARCLGLAFGVLTGGEGAAVADGILVSIANIGGIFSTWMLARTGAIAGIDIAISPLYRRVAWVFTFLVAVTATGPGLVSAIQKLATGNLAMIVSVASRLGDIFSFVLIAPLMLTALALRQGLLVWPWALLTASGMCWLAADFANAAFLHLGNGSVGPLYDIFRFPACLFVLTAGIAQRWVVDARELERA